MPSGLARWIREGFAEQDKTGLVPEESRRSITGYKNVIEVSGKYQARLQIKGDGVGGTRKRRQYSLPGLFDTALEAALFLAHVKKDMIGSVCDANGIPNKQNKQHKPRSKRVQPSSRLPAQLSLPMPTTTIWPCPSHAH